MEALRSATAAAAAVSLLLLLTLYGSRVTALSVVDVCQLPKEPGPCRARMLRYFYSVHTRNCQQFTYGGCKGNGNNFRTKEECTKRCARAAEKDVCQLPKETGLCKAYFPRFFFNPNTERCERFIYGGCGGNKNNFKTIDDCQATCEKEKDVCQLPKETGPCRGSFPRFFFNPNTERCERFIYGGCGGNKNNFKTIDDCQATCEEEDVCYLPKKVRPCRAGKPRFFYNSWTGKCEFFRYGGCRGNRNNFKTKEDCQMECGTEEDVCILPVKKGPCRARKGRFFFNAKTGRCQHFFYGGCQGNGNNFKTLADCQLTCSDDVCTLPKQPGKCRARMRRFFYNPKTQWCEPFIYGGCGGNDNNFLDIEECLDTCY